VLEALVLYAKEEVLAVARRGVSQHLLPDAPDGLNLLEGRHGDGLRTHIAWFTPFEPLMSDEEFFASSTLRAGGEDFERRLLARRLGVFAEITVGVEEQRFYRLRQAQVRVQMGAVSVVGRQRTRFCSLEHRWALVGGHTHSLGELVEVDLDVPELAHI
jgi:hypothetical protein